LPNHWRLAVLSTSGLAILNAGYLALVSFRRDTLPGCGPSSGCQDLLSSRWALFLGVPVSLLAILVYAVFFIAGCRLTEGSPITRRRRAWMVLVGCSFLMIFAAGWFVGLQIFFLKKVCPFCMMAQACASIAAGIVLFGTLVQPAPTTDWPLRNEDLVDRSQIKMIGLAALGGVAILIAGQTLHQTPTFLVKRGGAAGLATPKSGGSRQFSILNGKFQLNLEEEPLIGRPNAPHVMISLFDYTCNHCREMHGYLTQVHMTLSNQLAIVNLPMPLDSSCNKMIEFTNPAHTNACEYARIGLAVWRANRDLSGHFDNWIFATPSPPSLDEVRRYAAQLVGKKAFEEALRQEWIETQINRNISIYKASYLQDHNGRMPQLIVGSALIYGPLNQVSDLYALLSKELGLGSH
jgi:uncharacterized membrane protein